MTATEILIQHLKQKAEIIEMLSRLEKNRGWYGGDPKHPRTIANAPCIKFELQYGAHAVSNDQEINIVLVETTIKFYREKLKSIEFILGMAERAIQAEIGMTLLDFVKIEGAGMSYAEELPDRRPDSNGSQPAEGNQ